ncbi:hypothetical protein P171DRAFT_503289 [Karstenula rhodostoma CBS 690.94]|uniref:Uncharacterized protein n=1 Tax=Karstenula rhodostoma CBS 690.94 TaxID=1392251 RepID=A0A9P4UHX7_9PLEO|nr:hypothetical protein P171DRAFT_503289 [Karstenula rhodostoma CBS 690.94]
MNRPLQQSKHWLAGRAEDSCTNDSMDPTHNEEKEHMPQGVSWNEYIDPRGLFAQTPTSTEAIHAPTTSSYWRNDGESFGVPDSSDFVGDTTFAGSQNFDVGMSGSDVDMTFSGIQNFDINTSPPGGTYISNGEIHVKKGEKFCPLCGQHFVGGAAAIRKVG